MFSQAARVHVKPVKCDEALLSAARSTLIEALRGRMAPVPSDENGNFVDGAITGRMATVTGFKDLEFVAAFGPGLHRLSDAALVNQALLALIERVRAAPAGKTGLCLFDS